MSTARCIDLIAQVLADATTDETAYVLRTRLRRTIIAAVGAVGREAGITVGDLPCAQDLEGSTHPLAATTRPLIATLEELSAQVLQPSEALDGRWRRDWQSIAAYLRQLQDALLADPAG